MSFPVLPRERLNKILGNGMTSYELQNIGATRPELPPVDKIARATQNQQKPMVLWFTGLPASGKTTIAKRLEQKLHEAGHKTYLLDGDELRHGLNRDLGFSDADRKENLRRAGEVARILVDAGLIVLCAFISPFSADRRALRNLFENGEFLEIFVDTPIEECIKRDPKGHYALAKAGNLENFTGISGTYEIPELPDLHLETLKAKPDELCQIILTRLRI